EVSVGDFSGLAACFLFDHHINPPTTASRATAMRRPVGFMGYLLFHQVAMPMATTPSGKMTKLSQKTDVRPRAVMFKGRSSGALGRMEMRSSSDDSQFTMLARRSRLASEREPSMLFCDQSEVPTTTKRPGVAPEYVPAAPRVSGPLVPFL